MSMLSKVVKRFGGNIMAILYSLDPGLDPWMLLQSQIRYSTTIPLPFHTCLLSFVAWDSEFIIV